MAQQIDPRWRYAGWGYTVSSPDDLTRAISRIGTLQTNRRYVWRGAADRRWRVRSSIYRMLADEASESGPGPSEKDVRARERALLREAQAWGLGLGPGGFVNDLQLLATLQHHGVPTRLLDVTSNPMTALWFACQRAASWQDAAGALFAFAVGDVPEYPSMQPPDNTLGSIEDHLGWPLRRALQTSGQEAAPFLVRPSLPDSRMQAQEGLFISGAVPTSPSVAGVDGLPLLVGDPPYGERLESLFAANERRAGRPTGLPFVVLLIPPNIKGRMLPHLQNTYNRSQRILFPDVAGMVDALRAGQLNLSAPDPEQEP